MNELKLVENFDELKPGMRILDIHCELCNKKCIGILTNYFYTLILKWRAIAIVGGCSDRLCFIDENSVQSEIRERVKEKLAISQGRVFRFIDFDENLESEVTERNLYIKHSKPKTEKVE